MAGNAEDDSRGVPDLRPDAVVMEGVAKNGRPCRVVDNTASVAPAELRALLDDLIRADQFGLKGLSASGGNTVTLGAPVFTHIQIDGSLYRLIVFPYEARIESF